MHRVWMDGSIRSNMAPYSDSRLSIDRYRNPHSFQNTTEAAASNWPFWWLGAAAIAVFVTPGLSSAIVRCSCTRGYGIRESSIGSDS